LHDESAGYLLAKQGQDWQKHQLALPYLLKIGVSHARSLFVYMSLVVSCFCLIFTGLIDFDWQASSYCNEQDLKLAAQHSV
jgi:hypothetical protein